MKNEMILVGAISSQFTNDHEYYGEKYLRVTVTVTRDSGTDDLIPVIVSERLININDFSKGDYVVIKGQYRSYSLHNENKVKLELFMFATDFEKLSYSDNYNDVCLIGRITKPPVHRLTPLGREITDVILQVPREYGKKDFIPCVFWGKNAKFVSRLEVGDSICIAGRVQSRNYIKDGETKTAYEVSVRLLEITNDENEDNIIDLIKMRSVAVGGSL